MQLIARRTETVGKLIYYPFILLFLMLFARSEFMDHWSWPRPLLLILICNIVLAAYSAITLQYAARKARRVCLESLEEKCLDLQKAALEMVEDRKKAAGVVKLIRKCMKDIQKLSTARLHHFGRMR